MTKSAKNKKNKLTQADRADKYKLYQYSVQCVEAEIDFIDYTFKSLRNRTASTLREDFCGTAHTSCEWVRRRNNNHAIGVDLDQSVLDWGRENNLSRLTSAQQKRITLLNEDVMKVRNEPVDAVLAMNFSYWIFKNRPAMVKYFRNVYKGLKKDGVFFLDSFGGYEAFREMEERREYRKFTYVWDQASYNPINGHGLFKIHFKFKDGSKMKNAFVYDWRVWTLPELTEMLIEAGFKPTIYWEGTDKDGEGNGKFTPATQGEADAGWVVYIVAEK
jgi:cyclopropane fatty-acyl-phospholipid synthase-like methyltransferase